MNFFQSEVLINKMKFYFVKGNAIAVKLPASFISPCDKVAPVSKANPYTLSPETPRRNHVYILLVAFGVGNVDVVAVTD